MPADAPVKKKEVTLNEILAEISEENLHSETDFGQAGRELL